MASLAQSWMRTREPATVSFDDLFLAEYGRVVGIARRVLGNDAEAEDVAQEVFASFYAKYPPDSPHAAPWLYRAAAHTALNVLRGARRRRHRETREALGHERLANSAQTSLDPQLSVERTEDRQEVREALARLPRKSAAVLVLRYSDLSYAEVASALGVSVGQVGTLLRRAEAALRKEMTHDTPR